MHAKYGINTYLKPVQGASGTHINNVLENLGCDLLLGRIL